MAEGVMGWGLGPVVSPSPPRLVCSPEEDCCIPERGLSPLPRLFNVGGDVYLIRQLTYIDFKAILHIIEDLGIILI